MKKFLKLLVVVLLFIVVKVNAEGCGKYIVEQCNNGNCEAYEEIDYGSINISVEGVNCPDEYYSYWVSTPGHDYIIFSTTGDDTQVDSLTLPSGIGYYTRYRRLAPLEDSDKYGDIISCRDADYKYIKDCGCMPAALTDLTSRLYMLIKIAAPALLLIIGGFDLIKAMSAQDEKAINKARQKLVKKFIAAAAVFLIFTVIQFIVATLASDSTSTMKCVDYLLNGYVA